MNDEMYRRIVQSTLSGRDSDEQDTIAAQAETIGQLRATVRAHEQSLASQREAIDILERTVARLNRAMDAAERALGGTKVMAAIKQEMSR